MTLAISRNSAAESEENSAAESEENSAAEPRDILLMVVEDDPDIRELLAFNLRREGYQVIAAASGEEAQKQLANATPHLFILDQMLPGIDGLALCKKIRTHPACRHAIILFLTAKSRDLDIENGLESGADDYIVKPFSPRVLLARIRALLRRSGILTKVGDEIEDAELTIGGITLRPARHEVSIDDRRKKNAIAVDLTGTEFKLLHCLMSRPGIVFSRDQLLTRLHGDTCVITDRAIDVLIVSLRKKLGASGKLIETVWGVGYRFADR